MTRLDLRFYLDPATGEPHIFNHGVDEVEVIDVLMDAGEDRPGRARGDWCNAGGTVFEGGLRQRLRAQQYLRDYSIRVAGKTSGGLPAQAKQEAAMKRNRYPTGWNDPRVRAVMDHYEAQSEDQAVKEDEAAFSRPGQTVMVAPRRLVPEITRLIEKRRPARRTR